MKQKWHLDTVEITVKISQSVNSCNALCFFQILREEFGDDVPLQPEEPIAAA